MEVAWEDTMRFGFSNARGVTTFPTELIMTRTFGPDRRTIVGRNQPRALSTRSTGAKRYAWHGGDD